MRTASLHVSSSFSLILHLHSECFKASLDREMSPSGYPWHVDLVTRAPSRDTNTLLCTCVSRLCDATRSSPPQPELCASPLPPCLHLSGVLRSNYGRTTKMSEYTKSLSSSLNEKWKPNEKYYYFGLSTAEFPVPSCSLPFCFKPNGWNQEYGAEFFRSSLVPPSDSSKLLLNSLFDFADMSP